MGYGNWYVVSRVACCLSLIDVCFLQCVYGFDIDHLLSYFLGGDTQNASHTSARNAPNFAPSRDSRDTMEEDDDDEPDPPSTPAVQFYSHSGMQQHQHHRGASSVAAATGAALPSGSSSNSLLSMTAALVSGGPIMYQQVQQQMMNRETHSTTSPGISPISPAGLIGPGHENLMLPAAGRGGHPHHQQHQQLPMTDHERHWAWLQDLNARAKATSHPNGGADTMGPPPPQSASAYPQPVSAGTVPVGGHVVIPGYPMMYAQVAHMQHMVASPVLSPAETEEKRAKRLERNRESARKSRRRKKERLATLEAQVKQLQNEIEDERKKRIHAMIPSLTECRGQAIAQLLQVKGDEAVSVDLVPIIRNTGANSQISVVVTDFQYNMLKQMLLPGYYKVLIWLTLHEEAFFTSGKEEYIKREAEKLVARPSAAGRVSSKQVGDEMTNIPKGKADTGPGLQGEGSGEDLYNGDQPSQTSYANDAPRFWPLFCHWVSFSVDQEDRFLAAQRRVQDIPALTESRAQIMAAQRTTERLKGAVESLCSVVSQREEQTFLSILEPKQVAAYQDWLAANRERCRGTLIGQETPPDSKDTSLAEICRKLDELQLSKVDK